MISRRPRNPSLSTYRDIKYEAPQREPQREPQRLPLVTMRFLLLLTSLTLGTALLTFKKHDKVDASELHYELQPKYHVRPQQGWLNDPNGPIFHNGKYHLFFQHNEHDASWGHIVWGHATSSDLVHWELVSPILTKPPSYEKGGAWSGSMYKRGSDVVALYTCTDGKFRNAQCEATADDASLSSFTRNADNPIIKDPPEGVPPYYFRDPTEPFHWKGRDYTFIGATDPQGPRGAVLSYDLDGYDFKGHFYDAPPLQHCLGWRDGPGCASIMLECAARRLSLPSRRGDGVRPRRRRVDRRVEVHAIAATTSLRVRLRRPRRLRRERRHDPQAVAGRGAPQGRCSDWSRPAFNSARTDGRRKPGPYIYSE